MFLQGPPWQSGFFKLTLTGTNIHVFFLKGDFDILKLDIFLTSTSFCDFACLMKSKL